MKTFTIAVCILLSISSFGQDSLVYLNEIQYDSPYEKEVFSKYFDKKGVDLFELFISGGHLLTSAKIESEKSRLNEFIVQLNLSKYDGKKADKKIKAIYDGVHKRYLLKYSDLADFEDIFANGTYNSTAASILNALILEKESIPYQIKEDPGNIYLIAYPQTEQILLKADANLVVHAIDPTFKQSFINNLKEQKIISSKEVASMDLNRLFDKYYFGMHGDLTLINLVGIQYMNQAMTEIQIRNLKQAYQKMEKAYLFFPSERTSYLLFQIGTELVTTMESKNNLHAELLAKIARLTRYGVTSDMIKGEFGMVIQKLLFEKSDIQNLSAYFQTFQSHLKSPELKNEIAALYNYEVGRYHYNQGKYSESQKYFEEALKVTPNNQDVINAFVGTLMNQVNSNDNLKTIGEFKKYGTEYPILNDNNNFNSVLATAYLLQFGSEYDLGSPTQGAKYQIEFEKMMEGNSSLKIDQVAIGRVYSVVAIYFYRKGQTSKAKAIIEKGLSYAPNNYELLSRKRMIN